MNVASFVKLCLPLPPTPSKRAFPRGSPMTRHIRDVCSMASRNKTNFMGALLILLYSSKYDSATFCKVGISVTCSPELNFRDFLAYFGYVSRHRMIQLLMPLPSSHSISISIWDWTRLSTIFMVFSEECTKHKAHVLDVHHYPLKVYYACWDKNSPPVDRLFHIE